MSTIYRKLAESRFLLTELNEATYVEVVIIKCFNWYKEAKNLEEFSAKIDSDKELLGFIKSHSKSNFGISNDLDMAKKELYEFAKKLNTSVPVSAKASEAGRGKPSTSEFWKKFTGKSKDTSKADIAMGSFGVSVKKGPSQLMSGKGEEAKATLEAAVKISGLDKEIKDNLVSMMEDFADRTKTVIEDGVPLTTAQLANMGVDEIKEEQNKIARDVYDRAQKVRRDIVTALGDAFNKNPKFRNAFAYEAMTGDYKFDKKEGYASRMLMVDNLATKVVWEDTSDFSKPYVTATAGAMTLKVAMKSGSYKSKGKKLGYAFWQTVRLEVQKAIDTTDSLTESYHNEMSKQKELLGEGVLSEVEFLKKLKDLGKRVINGIKKAFNKLVKIFKKMVKVTKKLVDEGIEYVADFFSVGYDVNAGITVGI